MAYTTEKISSNQVRIDFTIPAERFEEAMNKAYLTLRRRINVPGFRKGKAPRKLIENMYGEAVFYDEAFEYIFPDLYNEAIETEDLHTVDRPEIDLKEIGGGKDLLFSATVYVMPEVSLGDYKKIEATKYLPPVTEEEINNRIEQDVRKVISTQEITDRPVQDGDELIIDYSGSVDEQKFEGGTAEDQRLKIGSNTFIPGFEEQLIGMNLGEEKNIKVTFPEDYHAKELAGKEAVFAVKVKTINEEIRPELDDDFAQDVSEHQTFEAYRSGIEEELKTMHEKNADVQLENNLIQQVTDASDCDIPPAMIDREIDNQIRNMKLRMAYQGLKFEDYLKYTGATEESLREMFRADATNTVKVQLVIDAIRKQEKIDSTAEEIDLEIEKHAKEIGRDAQEYKKSLSENQLANFKDITQARKVIEMLKENAQIDVKNEDAPASIDVGEVAEKVEEALEDEQA